MTACHLRRARALPAQADAAPLPARAHARAARGREGGRERGRERASEREREGRRRVNNHAHGAANGNAGGGREASDLHLILIDVPQAHDLLGTPLGAVHEAVRGEQPVRGAELGLDLERRVCSAGRARARARARASRGCGGMGRGGGARGDLRLGHAEALERRAGVRRLALHFHAATPHAQDRTPSRTRAQPRAARSTLNLPTPSTSNSPHTDATPAVPLVRHCKGGNF